MANKVVLVRSKVVKSVIDGIEQEGLILDSTIVDGMQTKIPVKGFVDFEIYNEGDTSIFLWKNKEIQPGQFYSPIKSSPIPYAEDIAFNFGNDYNLRRDSATLASVETTPQA